MAQNKNTFKQRILLFLVIILGVAITSFFGMRALHAFRKFNGHRPPPSGKIETDVELIRDWMTLPFITKTYRVPPEVIFEALGIPPQKDREKSLKLLNDEFYPDQDGYVLQVVKETILKEQARWATPPAPPSAPTAPEP